MAKRYVLIDDADADPSDLNFEAGPIYNPGSASPTVADGGSLLDAYLPALGESVTWKAKGAVNEYNEPTYLDTTITAIWYDDERLIRNEQGEELQQLAYIQCTALVQKGDLITRGSHSWPVIGIQKTPTFEGERFRIANLGQRII